MLDPPGMAETAGATVREIWRNAITAIFGQWIDDDEWSDADARRVVELVARENARRVSGLP
ncbi:hypothetical protein [Arthrobacter sp. MW3 TE3886]|uniref:hypothetical protein n=1 Tax=Arthrobacter sp. MW3 TE3886 TaxID=3156254 RepID=UPI003515E97A